MTGFIFLLVLTYSVIVTDLLDLQSCKHSSVNKIFSIYKVVGVSISRDLIDSPSLKMDDVHLPGVVHLRSETIPGVNACLRKRLLLLMSLYMLQLFSLFSVNSSLWNILPLFTSISENNYQFLFSFLLTFIFLFLLLLLLKAWA